MRVLQRFCVSESRATTPLYSRSSRVGVHTSKVFEFIFNNSQGDIKIIRVLYNKDGLGTDLDNN